MLIINVVCLNPYPNPSLVVMIQPIQTLRSICMFNLSIRLRYKVLSSVRTIGSPVRFCPKVLSFSLTVNSFSNPYLKN